MNKEKRLIVSKASNLNQDCHRFYLWTINPDDYDFLQPDWDEVLIETNIPIFRTSFGTLFFWNPVEDSLYISYLDILYNNWQIYSRRFVMFMERIISDVKVQEQKFDLGLHNQCLEKLGPLEADECYGFSPIPALGGDKSIEYAEKVKLKEYLSICAQAVS